jgi:hypothetical protein
MSKPAPHDDTPERLLAQQKAFAGHIRDPDRVAPPTDVEDRRMQIYRELFFKNIRNFISASYPVLKSLYSDEDWQRLVREFYVTPRFSPSCRANSFATCRSTAKDARATRPSCSSWPITSGSSWG